MTVAVAPIVLDAADWRARADAHAARVDALTAVRRERRAAHPVEDFLFTYYRLRPAQLRRWHPGAGVVLRAAGERSKWRFYTSVDAGVTVDLEAFEAMRGRERRAVARLLAATAARPPHLGCFGLHEWAMVYRSSAERRHERWPLRLGAEATDAVVEAGRLRCTHFDAFRFYTDPARPRNETQPTAADREHNEQPGCLHATMELYKWAYKLLPVVPSDLLLDCFELACDTRRIDMRASPYDLSALGLTPIPIETTAGRAEYVEHQRALLPRAQALRTRLLAVIGPPDARS